MAEGLVVRPVLSMALALGLERRISVNSDEAEASREDLRGRGGEPAPEIYASPTKRRASRQEASLRIVRVKGTDRIPVVLVGNKADLEHERQVPTSEGMILANRWGVPFYESSAKSTQNVNAIFTDCVVEIMHSSSPPKQTTGKCCRQCYVL
eukprot:XP_011673072.1 PREDICTED: ras-related protein Rap-2c-like [Strongylocentrotus purpuratus]